MLKMNQETLFLTICLSLTAVFALGNVYYDPMKFFESAQIPNPTQR